MVELLFPEQLIGPLLGVRSQPIRPAQKWHVYLRADRIVGGEHIVREHGRGFRYVIGAAGVMPLRG